MFELVRILPDRMKRSDLDLSSCAQFFLVHVACLLAFLTGVSWVAIIVCLSLYVVRMFAITAGFHRLFSHRTYQTSRFFQFLMAFAGTTSYQKGPLWWSAHHRAHHLNADTSADIHSPIKHSIWQSHLGWFLSRESLSTDKKLISNLIKFRELRLLDRFYPGPPIMLAVATFLLGAALEKYFPDLGTSGWQMLVWGFFISTVLLYHGTFTVNSVAHLWGSRRYETPDGSRNNLLIALITLGEGWHNNHHYYQASERQGFYWWELDMSHYTLKVLAWLGVVWNLKEPPARIFAEQSEYQLPSPDPSL